MPHITTNYKMYLPAGHHRQPRNASAELSLTAPSGGDTPYSPPFFPQLPYTLPNNGGQGAAELLFWNDTDGTTGIIRPPQAFDIPSAASARTVTGWYFPISGPGLPGNGSAIIDDAFSASLGRFIDDTFVDVTSDPSLTADANVIGVVPTNVTETLVAKAHVTSTPDGFSQWILNESIMPVGVSALNVPALTDGIAIAVYQHGTFPKAPRVSYEELVRIFFGVINDAPGLTDHGPIGPWGPLIARLARTGLVATQAEGLQNEIGAQIGHLAAQDAVAAIHAALKEFENRAGKAD